MIGGATGGETKPSIKSPIRGQERGPCTTKRGRQTPGKPVRAPTRESIWWKTVRSTAVVKGVGGTSGVGGGGTGGGGHEGQWGGQNLKRGKGLWGKPLQPGGPAR